MAKIPAEHQAYLRRRPFAFRCSTSIFPTDELEVLAEYGNWMEALVAGIIAPATRAHEHFLRVDREESEPSTVGERAWLRLKGRREYEQDQEHKAAAPTPAPEEYGMVEWDADRCWW